MSLRAGVAGPASRICWARFGNLCMQAKLSVLWMCLCAPLAVGCAHHPEHAAPAAESLVRATQLPAPGSAVGGEDGSAVNVSLVKEGYRAQLRQGQVFYCRSEPVTGTMFHSKVCRTRAQIESLKRATQTNSDELSQQRRVYCVGPECAGH
jgi:hypothetical protein